MEKKTHYEEMQEFLSLLLARSPIPDRLASIKAWYDIIIYFSKIDNVNIIDSVTTLGRRFYGCFDTHKIPIEQYMRIVRQLAMFEATMNHKIWETYRLSSMTMELRKKQLEDILKSDSEREHFEKEFVQLGDAAEDISGASVRLLPIPERPITKKAILEQKKRIG